MKKTDDKQVKNPPVPAEAEAVGPETGGEAAPSGEARSFPIVGIGASAGGLAAFAEFFSGMPAGDGPGMAFVLVQHLAPDHKSILSELVRRYTRMEVFEVEDGMEVRPDCAYIIPPNRDMAFLNGTLQLLEPSLPRGHRLPIDFFFRSLAQDQRERAIGIVLSGTGSDGTQGVRAIKGEGGMVMVQKPETTEFDGMPHSAIATSLVDYVLPPAQMPAQLIAYASHVSARSEGNAAVADPLNCDNALKKICVLLRSQTGHDFSQYKPSTICRRIERRMAVHQIPNIDAYVLHLRQHAPEVEALFRDLLIGVTNFFRDPEVFHVFEDQVVPKLFARKPTGSMVRVWVAGCSTGEEAYSLAMLLAEYQETLKKSYQVQIFATDIDNQAVAVARSGLYPASIAEDVSPERLARFFTLEADGGTYRIHRGIRDLVVFSEQNVIKDPPFSKLDVVSCRNLMIYLGVELQKKLIPLFHYALNPGGFLLLGTSESVGGFGELFAPLDSKSKIYQRKEGAARAAIGRFLPLMTATEVAVARPAGKPAFPVKPPLRELTEQALLEQIAPAGALVNSGGDILYLHGRSGMYLEPSPGESGINNVLKMARQGLQQELTAALHKASVTQQAVRCPGLRVKSNGHFTTVNLSIHPLAPSAKPLEAPLFLVLFEDAPEVAAGERPDAAPGGDGATDVDARVVALKQELRAKEDYLQATNEELEASNEELKSSNEEMQSVNEELQSTNEELETSKEELQSVNEELATVNTELQTKVADLSRSNDDMNNLLAGTGIATVFVDHQVRILRFTPTTAKILNLIGSDVGRPMGHIVSNLVSYHRLVDDVRQVFDTLVPQERVVQTADEKWHLMRIQPYRTLENVIEGAVITFVDITDRKQTEESLRKANDLLRFAMVVRDCHDAIVVQDLAGATLAWNPAAARRYGWTEAEGLTLNLRDRVPEALREDVLAKLGQVSLEDGIDSYPSQRLTKDGTVIEVSISPSALIDETGKVYAVATTERVIRKR